jgi:tight adherence protein C
MSSNYVIGLVVLLLLVAIYFYIMDRAREMLATNRLNRLLAGPSNATPLLGLTQIILAAIAYPLAGAKERAKLAHRLAQADLRQPFLVNLFLLAKLILVIGAIVFTWNWLDLSLAGLIDEPLKSLQLLFFTFLGARLPDWWLSGRIKARWDKIRASVPQAIDYLTICVESGLSLEESFGRVSREIQRRFPEVAAEFKTTRMEMLVMDRKQALKRLEKRSGVSELSSMANSLLQSIQYGTPLTNALHTIATECRANQISDLEEKAGAISAKIGIPLVLLILFPLVALIAAPALISLMRTFGSFVN